VSVVSSNKERLRWLLRQALAGQPRTKDTVRGLLALTGAPTQLQTEAYRLARAEYLEGYCPVHGGPFAVKAKGSHRQAYCEPCNRNWGKPTQWAASSGDDL
jgi:hypothetical protein